MRLKSATIVVKFFENGRVFADEFDGAEREVEGSGLFDDGDGEGFGGFVVDEGEESEERFEILFAFDGVVEAAVADEGECAGEESAEMVAVGSRGGVAEGEDGEAHCCDGMGCWEMGRSLGVWVLG